MSSPDPQPPKPTASPTLPAKSPADGVAPVADQHKAPLVSPPSDPVPARRWPWLVGLVLLAGLVTISFPWIRDSLNTVSTDDAYVNGHVTFVAPRVGGQVRRRAGG